MKKMNNKGFAITTIVYGLSLMGIMLIAIIMGVLASTRNNNRAFSRKVAEELKRFGKTETAFDASVTDEQLFTVPDGEAGWYKIELWGAQGGGILGGRGAYTSGIIELEEKDMLYFYVGKHSTTYEDGPATEVRVKSVGEKSYTSRIMVAAGGGSSAGAAGGTLFGYTASATPIDGRYDSDTFLLSAPSDDNPTNGTLLGFPKGYSYKNVFKDNVDNDPSFNPTEGTHPVWYLSNQNLRIDSLDSDFINKHYANYSYISRYRNPFGDEVYGTHLPGGGGYIRSQFVPYSHSQSFNFGGSEYGGASFISGYAGCYAYNTSGPGDEDYTLTPGDNNQMWYNPTYIHYGNGMPRDYIFYDGMMYPGVNTGDGKARITKLVSKSLNVNSLPRQNHKLDEVNTVVFCTDREVDPVVKVISQGVDVGQVNYHHFTQGPVSRLQYCYSFKLADGSNFQVDELAFWLRNDMGVDLNAITVSVGNASDSCATGNSECRTELKDYDIFSPSVDTIGYTGLRFSAYQIDSMGYLSASGNYIIQSVLSENKVLTAAETSEQDSNPIKIDYMNNHKYQQWSVERVYNTPYGDGVYKIVDLVRFKALSVNNDENKVGNTIVADRTFNDNAIDETQLWKITPLGDGTYLIKSVVESFNESVNSGYIVPQTNPNKDNYNNIIIGSTSNDLHSRPDVLRWKFISLDYSSSDV